MTEAAPLKPVAVIASKSELLRELAAIPDPRIHSIRDRLAATNTAVWPDNHLEDE